MKNIIYKISDYCVDILIVIIVLLVGFKLIKLIEKYLKKEHKFSKIDPSAKSFIVSAIGICLKILLFILCAYILGVPMTSLITLLASCGLAVGLALQGGLSNLAGGLMILIFKPFKVGDYIEANGKEGIVKSISIFYTSLTTPDNKVVQFPNGSLSNGEITNYSANKYRRLDIELSVSYNTKIDKVKKIITEIIDKSQYVIQDKEKVIRLLNHADSALVFILKVWVENNDYWEALYTFKEDIKEAFDKNKIEIPYTQIDIHNR